MTNFSTPLNLPDYVEYPDATYFRFSEGEYYRPYYLPDTPDQLGLQSSGGDNGTVSNDGTLVELASPRIGLGTGLISEDSRQNAARDNTGTSAVVGDPGTLPDGWNLVVSAALNTSIVSVGVEDGINYIDVRVQGTPTGTNWQIAFNSASDAPAAVGQDWTASAYVAIVGGTLTNIDTTRVRVIEGNPGFLAVSDVTHTLTPTLTRLEVSRTFSDPAVSTAFGRVALSLNVGQAIDITLRIGLPQLEQSTFASSPIKTFGSVVSRTADSNQVTNLALIGATEAVLTTGFTIIVEGSTQQVNSNVPYLWQIDDGTGSNRHLLRFDNSTGVRVFSVINNTFNSVNGFDSGTSLQPGEKVRSVVVITPDAISISSNGNTVRTNTPAPGDTTVFPGAIQVWIGRQLTGQRANGPISEFIFIPRALPLSLIQGLSTIA